MINDITKRLVEKNPLYRKWVDIVRSEVNQNEDRVSILSDALDSYANNLYKKAILATEQQDYHEAIILNAKKEQARGFMETLRNEGFETFYAKLPRTHMLTTEDDTDPRIYKY